LSSPPLRFFFRLVSVSADEPPIALAPKEELPTAGVEANEKLPLGAALESTAGVDKAGVLPKLKAGAGAERLLAGSVLVVGAAPKVNAGLAETESSVVALGAGKADDEAKAGGAVFCSVDLAPN
jgi:hypothetical protein